LHDQALQSELTLCQVNKSPSKYCFQRTTTITTTIIVIIITIDNYWRCRNSLIPRELQPHCIQDTLTLNTNNHHCHFLLQGLPPTRGGNEVADNIGGSRTTARFADPSHNDIAATQGAIGSQFLR
jgi:hypothetical protein